MHAHIDFETRSTCDLRKCGADVYAQHFSTEVLCLAYAFDEETPRLWVPGDSPPIKLLDHVASGGTCIGHNLGAFEMLIWNSIMTLKYDWPELKIEQCEDTMAMAYAMGLPGSLDDASRAAGIDIEKDMKGHRVMLQLCQPRSFDGDTPIYWDEVEHKDKYEILYRYCVQDVEVERSLYQRLRKLSPQEKRVWELDYKINRRGVYVDMRAAQLAVEIVESEKTRLNNRIRKVTGNAVAMCTAVGQLSDWLKFKGLDVPSVAKADVTEMLSQDLPAECREALLLRQEAAKTSTAKLQAMINGASAGGRMRGLFQYHGASTGRWAGRRVQLQNLPRPSMKQDDIEEAFQMLELPDAAELIRDKFGSPLSVVSDCVRGFLRARPGYKFIAADFSAIEARVLAWLANEEKVLDVFRSTGKIYEHAAAGIYGKPIDEITKDERQIGKVAVLALGYGGGVGAFQTLARGYNVEIADAQADSIKIAWRAANLNIVNYWAELNTAAVSATLYPGKKYLAGIPGRQIAFIKNGSFLWCRLPSGRVNCYPYPKIQDTETPWGETRATLTYMSVDSYTKKWSRTKTYGGKLAENITQAVSADLIREAMFRLEESNFPIVMHVHDEVVCEVKLGDAKTVEHILSEVPEWATGLPIEASGWEGLRFRK